MLIVLCNHVKHHNGVWVPRQTGWGIRHHVYTWRTLTWNK